MTAPAPSDSETWTTGDVPCSYHPNVMTRLRCSRCARPICPRDAVRTPVGLRCPDCAGVRGLRTYRTSSSSLVKATGAGLAVAIIVGVVWGYFPDWQFFLALLLGFGAVEVMARLSGYKRGLDLQLAAIAVVVVGLVISRLVMANRYDIPLADVNQLAPYTTYFMQLRLIPNLVYAALPLVIAWFRFR